MDHRRHRTTLWALIGGLAILLLAAALRYLATAPTPGSGQMLGGLGLPTNSGVAELRLLRVATGIVVGAALGISGSVLQTMLRNPLASPEILGASAGGSFAVLLAAVLGASVGGSWITGLVWQAAPAAIGAIGALLIVLSLGRRNGVIDPLGVVLMGIVVSIMCSAGLMLVQSLTPELGTLTTWRLLSGELSDDTPLSLVLWLSGLLVALLVWSWAIGPAMDAASLGDDEAWSVGIRTGSIRLQQVLVAGAAAAVAVSIAGPVAFVGLMAPHIVRLAGPSSARTLIVVSAIAGAALVLLSDTLIRIVDVGTGRLPLGVLTSLIGGPTMLFLLRRELRGRERSSP